LKSAEGKRGGIKSKKRSKSNIKIKRRRRESERRRRGGVLKMDREAAQVVLNTGEILRSDSCSLEPAKQFEG